MSALRKSGSSSRVARFIPAPVRSAGDAVAVQSGARRGRANRTAACPPSAVTLALTPVAHPSALLSRSRRLVFREVV